VSGNVAYLSDTKNGTPRAVPLSARALAIWQEGPFNLTPARLDAHFRQIRERAGLPDIHYHDSRRTAASRLAKILNPYELARMLGHKDLSMTLNTYYKDDPQQIAEKLG
jgi:integrase